MVNMIYLIYMTVDLSELEGVPGAECKWCIKEKRQSCAFVSAMLADLRIQQGRSNTGVSESQVEQNAGR